SHTSAGDDCRANGLYEIGRRAVRGDVEKIYGSGNRLCCPAPMRGPQPHAACNLGQISSSDPLPRPVADPQEIFLKRAKSGSFAKTSVHVISPHVTLF